MSSKRMLLGIAISFLAGWLAAGATHRAGTTGELFTAKVDSGTPRGLIPGNFGSPAADRWLAGLDPREIEQRILRLARAPETGKQKAQLVALFDRLFELDGTSAADRWLEVEADCQPDLTKAVARWAARSPDEAVAWLGRSLDEIRRFRSGSLVVEIAEEMIQAITARDPELGAGLLMQDAAFYDPRCLYSVGLELEDPALTEQVVRWAARQGDDPRNGLKTLSGNHLDAGGWGIWLLSSSKPDTAISLYDSLPSGDKRRDTWLPDIVQGWSERDRPSAMTWWIQVRSDKEWDEGELMPLMDWARDEPDQWLPWMAGHLPSDVADDAMAMAIERTSPASQMHLRLCAAIRSEELRSKMIAQIREDADLDSLRDEVEGNEVLEELLDGP